MTRDPGAALGSRSERRRLYPVGLEEYLAKYYAQLRPMASTSRRPPTRRSVILISVSRNGDDPEPRQRMGSSCSQPLSSIGPSTNATPFYAHT